MITVGMQGDDYIVMRVEAAGIATIKLTEEDAKLVRDYLCTYLGVPSPDEVGTVT